MLNMYTCSTAPTTSCSMMLHQLAYSDCNTLSAVVSLSDYTVHMYTAVLPLCT